MNKIIGLFAGVILILSSCGEVDNCKDVACGDQGNCDDGICVCLTGYEQDVDGLCNTEIREKFIGSWTVTDACTASSSSAYTVTATKNNTNLLDLNITNFWDVFNANVVANVDGLTFNIARQEPDNDDFFVQSIGDATINAALNRVNVTFVITDETVPGVIAADTCTSTWVK